MHNFEPGPCSEWTEQQLADFHARSLSPFEQEALQAHLDTCSACRAVLSEYQWMDEQIHQALIAEPLPSFNPKRLPIHETTSKKQPYILTDEGNYETKLSSSGIVNLATTTTHQNAVNLFLSYSYEDEPMLRQLEAHLIPLKRRGLISLWHDRLIRPGTDWAKSIDTHLETASLIILLVSADFVNSDYCYGVEMKRALERHATNEARVIPIILRPVDWTSTPFAHLQALPTDAKAITTSRYQDEVWANVATGIRLVIDDLLSLKTSMSRAEKSLEAYHRTSQDHQRILPSQRRSHSPDRRDAVAFNEEVMGAVVKKTKPLEAMSLKALFERGTREMGKYRRGEPGNDGYYLEIFRRAVVLDDHDAWIALRELLSESILLWFVRHPYRKMALRYEPVERSYVDDTIRRFWQAISDQGATFSSVAGAMSYLHLCLNAAIMDILRAYARPREEPIPDPGSSGEPVVEDAYDEGELWEAVKSLLPNERERRLAFLLFHCNLKPREIMRYCLGEFKDENEIYRLKRNILNRILRSREKIRWRLDSSDF